MLVLQVKKGEPIVIGDDIAVVVVRCGKENVKLGITAPKNVAVDRAKIRDAKQQEVSSKSGMV